MESQTKAFGHAIHPMLIVFPLGLLTTAVVFDVLEMITDQSGFTVAAAYAIAAGVVGGVFAAGFGIADWLAIPTGTRARRVGLLHGAGNLVVLLLFAASWLLRANAANWEPSAWALVLSFSGVALAGITGWMGGELVDRLGVGIDDDAHLNAPSSLSHKEARLPTSSRTAASG